MEIGEHMDQENKECIVDFTEKSWSSDLTLIIEGTNHYVDKNILALASPVFYRMFQSGFQESGRNEIDLPGKKKSEVTELLRCIYPNSLTEVSHHTALMILPLVEEYQVTHVKARCEKALLESLDKASATAESLCKLLNVACLYNLKELRTSCVNFVSQKSQEEMESAYKRYPLPADALNEILVKVNVNLRKKLSDLKLSNTVLTEEIDSLKNYFIGDLKHAEGFPLVDEHTWKKEDLLMILEVDKMDTGLNKNVVIWDSFISLNVKQKMIPNETACFPHKFVNEQWLHFEITLQTFSTKSMHHNIYLRFVLLDRVSKAENLSFSFRKEVKGNHATMNLALKKMSYIKQKFARDGKLALLVQIHMSKPVYIRE